MDIVEAIEIMNKAINEAIEVRDDLISTQRLEEVWDDNQRGITLNHVSDRLNSVCEELETISNGLKTVQRKPIEVIEEPIKEPVEGTVKR